MSGTRLAKRYVRTLFLEKALDASALGNAFNFFLPIVSGWKVVITNRSGRQRPEQNTSPPHDVFKRPF